MTFLAASDCSNAFETRFAQPGPQLPKRKLFHIACLAIVSALLCVSGTAQQSGQTGATNTPSPAQSTDQSTPVNPVQTGAAMVDLVAKKSLVFPDLAMSEGPLTSGQKFKLAVNNSVSLSAIFVAATSAGINQAYDSPAGYGQGGEGYGKRFGAAMARNGSYQVFGTWMLASALHQDPRFFVRNDLNLGGSIKYAIHRVFITRSDSGQQVVNWSGLIAPIMSEGLANAYYPDDYRTVGNTFSRYGYDLMWSAAANLARQYWPRINKRLRILPAQPVN